MTTTVYLKCRRNVLSQKPDIYMKDVAALRCADPHVSARLNALKVHHFTTKEPQRCILSTLRLIELIEENCPGATVDVIGESDVLIEWIQKQRPAWIQKLLVIFVCIICFCGTAFTIMSYHNDVAINTLFAIIYRNVMGREPSGFTVLEVTYSIGLALGIIVFFNHVGPKKITKDPTPIEVSMKIYEEDVDRSIIDVAERSGWEIDRASQDHQLKK